MHVNGTVTAFSISKLYPICQVKYHIVSLAQAESLTSSFHFRPNKYALHIETVSHQFIKVFLFSPTAITSARAIVQLKVPLYADPRRAAELSCDFKIENENIHSVKFYRDTHEIFRFIPAQEVRTRCSYVLYNYLLKKY